MCELQHLEVIRLRAASSANSKDAALWPWFSDMMEDNRVTCIRKADVWSVRVDGRLLTTDRSFDRAVRAAYVLQRARNTFSVVNEGSCLPG